MLLGTFCITRFYTVDSQCLKWREKKTNNNMYKVENAQITYLICTKQR
jgi:hypothetical protein